MSAQQQQQHRSRCGQYHVDQSDPENELEGANSGGLGTEVPRVQGRSPGRGLGVGVEFGEVPQKLTTFRS